MNALDRLNEYFERLERRLRLRELSRGVALLGAAALALTVLLVVVINWRAFSPASVIGARIALFSALALVVVFGLVLPLVRLNRIRAARRAERAFPEFEQRLLTFAERSRRDPTDPFLVLLADDALRVARTAEPRQIFTRGRILGLLSAAGAAVIALIWLGVSGPGYLGYGTSLLWAGAARGSGAPFYDIRVVPGDHKVRRGADQLVSAYLSGFESPDVRLMARYEGASKWEEVRMRPEAGGSGFEFLFAGLPESVDYYIVAGAVRTRQFRLQAIDLPRVKRIRVTYHYPAWTRLAATVEENGGDLRAVEGTEAELTIETDQPLDRGVAVLSEGPEISLAAGPGNSATGRVPIRKDGLYHIAAVYEGEKVRLTEDFFIEAIQETPPSVRISRPGRDYRANPIEEVTIAAEAGDDFGLQEFSLLYSVNGGPEQKIDLLARPGAKEASGAALIALEDHKLVPGDVVSFYAAARDARTSTRTDMFFIEAQPFEREYSQSQMSGGMGGGGGEQDQNRISERQKEIIAATWNVLRDQNLTRAKAAEDGKFLSDVQSALRDQAISLARRMQARELAGTNEEFKNFARDMEAAAAAMGEAAGKLKGLNWQEAIPPEQKALQHLLRAESMFRRIQVARGSRGGGGGGGNMGRDLENLFDLELDTEKNQYETGQRGAGVQQARDIDEALEKLKELARRQQELAQQQQRQRQSFEQRWQQEMLRREAEQLERRIAELARGQSSQGSSSPSSQQARSRGGAQGGSGTDARLQQALERLRQATEEMRRAGSQGGEQRNAESRRAAERLQEATELLSGLRRQEAGQRLGEIGERARKLAGQQRDFADKLKNLYAGHQALTGRPAEGRQAAVDPREVARLAEEKKAMADELQRLERQMQQAVRDLAGSQRAASSKLREALGEMQQRELSLRMKYLAEWIRRGLGAYAWLREAPVTEGLERLSQQLGEAERALGESSRTGETLETALSRVEQLRNELQRLTEQRRRSGNGAGRERGEGGRQGAAEGGNQPGEGPGRQAPGAGDGRGGGWQYGGGSGPLRSFSAMNTGERLPPETGLQPPAADFRALEQAYREGLRDLAALRQSMRDHPELATDLQELIRQMQRLDPKRFPGNPALVEQLRTQLVPTLEHVELRLRRQLEDSGEGQVRSGLARPVPPGYADAVAEYYRKLSRTQ